MSMISFLISPEHEKRSNTMKLYNLCMCHREAFRCNDLLQIARKRGNDKSLEKHHRFNSV